jgi:hypothetical protein
MPGSAGAPQRRIRRVLGTASVACAVVLVLGACGSTSHALASAGTPAAPPSAPPVKGAAADIADPGLTQGMALPLEAYMESYPEQSAIVRAQLKLVKGCMAKFGFDYAPPAPTTPLSNDDANMNRRYGLSDLDEAAQYGYHLPNYAEPQAIPPQPSSAEELVLIGHSVTDRSATPAPASYHGIPVPANGCIGSSSARLGAPLNTALPDQLDSESLSKSQAEPVVQTALHAWSGCMKSKGYTVDTPFNAASLAPSSNGSSPTSQEIQVAEADVACKQQTGLIRTWFTAETAVQDHQVEQNQLALDQLRQQISAAVKASAAVTG